MMKSGFRWFLGGALALTLSAAAAQTPAPLLKHTFEDGEGGWTGITFPSGMNAKVSITNEAANVKSGKAALKFDYGVNKGEMNALLLATPNGEIAKAKALRLWIKADYTTTLALVLQEQDGGRYVTVFSAPKDQWQQVEVSTADFTLMEGKDDPQDPDSKLDMDQVAAVAIGDFGQFFAQLGDENVAKLLNVQAGQHTLYLDDFTVTEETLPSAFSAVNADVRIDTFARPQLAWIAVGGVKLSKAEGKPLEGPGMKADYRQAPQKIIGIMRNVPRGKMAGTDKLTFTAASTKRTMLVVQVEEKDGGKFNSTVEIPDGSEAKTVSLNFADFNPADDSPVKDRKVKMDLVNQILFIDATGLLGGAEEDNTLWIGGLRASAAK
jgi:hypothetical protein